MFDINTIEKIKCYVYALFDSESKFPFYIGKGTGNRVFDHVACALKESNEGDKYETIRKIKAEGRQVNHVIIRHFMTDDEALLVEACIIDLLARMDINLTNLALGQHSSINGLMTADEIIRKYNALPLKSLEDPVIIININKTYSRCSSSPYDDIYNATRASWVVHENRTKTIRYALSEYHGIIVEVFQINRWYKVQSKNQSGKDKTRWAFDGIKAADEIRNKYINRTISHVKKRGAANPIRYTL